MLSKIRDLLKLNKSKEPSEDFKQAVENEKISDFPKVTINGCGLEKPLGSNEDRVSFVKIEEGGSTFIRVAVMDGMGGKGADAAIKAKEICDEELKNTPSIASKGEIKSFLVKLALKIRGDVIQIKEKNPAQPDTTLLINTTFIDTETGEPTSATFSVGDSTAIEVDLEGQDLNILNRLDTPSIKNPKHMPAGYKEYEIFNQLLELEKMPEEELPDGIPNPLYYQFLMRNQTFGIGGVSLRENQMHYAFGDRVTFTPLRDNSIIILASDALIDNLNKREIIECIKDLDLEKYDKRVIPEIIYRALKERVEKEMNSGSFKGKIDDISIVVLMK